MSWFEKARTVLIEALDIQDDDSKATATTPTADSNVASVTGAGGGSSGSGSNNNSAASTTAAASTAAATTTAASSSMATSAIEGATFYDNPHANEMVTIPPRASASDATTDTLYANKKRQSATSDSVDLLSSPSPTTPSSQSVGGCMRNSESSLELITAPSTASEMELQMSPDTEPSLPDSIVIIASNETSSDNAEEDDDDDGQAINLEQDDHSLHLNDSTKTMKALVFSDTQTAANVSGSGAGADSDSTQSFEDIQLQLSHKSPQPAASISSKATEMVDQSYSSTSSDIEIISNPNGGDSSTNSTTTRTSPQKFKELCGAMKQPQALHALHAHQGVKGKGHHREPSEISLLSESDSQSELDKLVHRISELNQVIEAREQRLLQSERQNAELLERNQQLCAHVEAAKHSAESTEANEAVQRLSALEKKFQGSIRERDALRIQIKSLKDELLNKIPRDELTECNEMIAGLQSEGEKLSKEILQQSNIIKKLRAKEKTSDTLLKKNGEQISLLSSESERLKKSLAAKEEMERSQIEAVNRMTNEKRRVDEENAECRSRNEDLQSMLAALQASFDGVKGDLQQRQRHEQHQIQAENQEYVQQLSDMREKLRLTEHNMAKREQQLREENRELLRRLEAAESRAESSTQELSVSTTPLIRQIESLQKTLNQRNASWSKDEQQLLQKLEDSQAQLRSLQQLESVQHEKQELLRTRCALLEEKLANALMQSESAKITLRQQELDASLKESDYQSQVAALQEQLQQRQQKLDTLLEQCQQLESESELQRKQQLQHQQRAFQPNSELTVEAVKASSELAESRCLKQQQQQQQLHASPPLSLVDDSGSTEEALGGIIDWQGDDLECASNSGRQPSGMIQGVHLSFLAGNTTTLEHLQALLKQRDGELTHLQWELSRLQAERGVLDGEISNLTIELETLKERVVSYEAMEKGYEDLQHRYDALLQMYGEKVERTEELELDLVELKQAYKLQIDELLAAPPPNLQRTPKHL
ncbi:TATA element modulatory factor [Drosophila sulfurigaster albostrigata]|uniref:TATA element modulatory factor n=1 Tax=Drosophila sulfurigaster albostrigata TaxID=89887 RepID=UPI002D21BA7C|nr:TATA element modulatory factor [Drosophila sulfurigaster albostrigata]